MPNYHRTVFPVFWMIWDFGVFTNTADPAAPSTKKFQMFRKLAAIEPNQVLAAVTPGPKSELSKPGLRPFFQVHELQRYNCISGDI